MVRKISIMILIGLIALLQIGCASFLPVDTKQPKKTVPAQLPIVTLPDNRMFLGVYDLSSTFAKRPMDVQEQFISWEKYQSITEFIEFTRKINRIPFITIEPRTTYSGNLKNILDDTGNIIDGKSLNDSIMQKDALAIKAQAPQKVFVRFAHEMDLVGNYPWSQKNTDMYIAAFRHYHDVFAVLGVTNVEWVWSPAGNSNAVTYYPGSQYVDYIGVTLLGYEAWDIKQGSKKGQTFDQLFSKKYGIVKSFNKPIIIPELGVSSMTKGKTASQQDAYRTTWLKQALDAFRKYSMLRGVIYFNAVNAPNAWMAGDTPDWRIKTSNLWDPTQMPLLHR